MKDSRGQTYHGWVLKTERGRLLFWTFHQTRAEVYQKHDYPWVMDLLTGRRILEAVKVRLMEVV